MPIIELNRKKGVFARNDYSSEIRVAFAKFGYKRTGAPKIGLLINIGEDLMGRSVIKPTDKISLEIDTDHPSVFLIKRCKDGYCLSKIGSSYKTAVTWKLPIPNDKRSTRVVRHAIVDNGIKVYLED